MVYPVPAGTPISAQYKATNPGLWKTCGYHTGVDFAAPVGTPVFATVDGTVRHVDYGPAFGDRCVAVVADDGSGEGFFAHLNERVPHGTRVKAGDLVGRVGKRGNTTGAHLHYEWLAGAWNCDNIRDPWPSINRPKGDGPFVTPNVYVSKLRFGQRDSDSVKELQERLNRVKLVGGANLPVTGNYLEATDAEVRKWQEQVCGDAPDPAGASSLGPRQAARMFPSPPYTVHDDRAPVEPPKPPTLPDVPAWSLAPSLAALRAEVDALWPDRSKASDGTIGDAAHAASKSEHNPVGSPGGPQFGTPGSVHAIDLTREGLDVERLLRAVVGDPRVWYVIHAGKIWSKTHGWAEQPYTGSNPHTTHVHVSLRADDQADALKAEADVLPWFKPEPARRTEFVVAVTVGADGVPNLEVVR